MAGPISRLPKGLSSLLQLKGGLSNPVELLDVLVPTLSLLDFYQVDKRERSSASIVLSSAVLAPSTEVIDTTTDTTVPNDEIHIVWHAHWQSLLPNNNIACQIAPGLRVSGSAAFIALPDLSFLFALDDFLVAPYKEMPLFALPGTQFAFRLAQFSAGSVQNYTFSIAKEFTRLKV